MELLSIALTNFRRFEGTETLKTEGKLVAVIGPNETGKSSVLEALASLNNNKALPRRATTWGKEADETEIEATFRLTADESSEMSGAVRVTLTKIASGERTIGFIPQIRRDRSLRHRVVDELRSIVRRSSFEAMSEQSSIESFIISQEIDILAAALSKDVEDLPDETLVRIRTFLTKVRKLVGKDRPKYFDQTLERLERLHQLEILENPREEAGKKVNELLPSFALFSNDMRMLEDSYVVADVAKNPPVALRNLLALAGVTINEFAAAVGSNILPEIRTLEDKANKSLESTVSNSWSQSDLIVRLTCDAGNLRVLVQDTSNNYSDLSERSDGLRQFVALRAFMSNAHLKNPVLLIDELEQRLHYDAQADLVQVLQSQTLAPKVIYTTHSAGSLPEDLGVGVHVVAKQADQPHHSKIINRFWEGEEPGYSPLLVGLGASTLAFFPMRRALVAEGSSEMILVPRLLRDALEMEHLDFQVVPGLSSVSRTKLPALSANGSQVCYLVDGDSGGSDIVNLLRDARVADQFIFSLKIGARLGASIEDFVNPDALLEAANRLGTTYTESWTPIVRRELPSIGRGKSLENAFRDRGQTRFSKVDLAYVLLDVLAESKVSSFDQRRVSSLRELGQSIRSTFKKA